MFAARCFHVGERSWPPMHAQNAADSVSSNLCSLTARIVSVVILSSLRRFRSVTIYVVWSLSSVSSSPWFAEHTEVMNSRVAAMGRAQMY